jgi:diguanylate cyclase (GGDEF)-like protein
MRMRSADWKLFAAWVVGVVLAAACLGWVIRAESARQLQQGAEQSGLRWARFASRTVPDLGVAFAGGGITPAARDQLQRLRRADDIFRFKLFDPAGRLVLLSDDLDRADATLNPSATDGIGHDAAGGAKVHIRDKVLAGQAHVELKREARPDRPAIYSEAYVPVLQDGKVLGVVEVYVDQVERATSVESAFSRIAGAILLVLVLMLAVAGYQLWLRLRQQRRAEARVRYMAHHDALSGALNRASFTEALQQAAWRRNEGGPGFALLCLDLDHFKEVNDTMGHAAGDEVLRVATQRLNDAVREGDKVARLGGDEFAILLSGVSSVEAVTPLAQRMVEALAVPFEVHDQRVRCGGSVGIAIYGVDATEPEDLLGKADLALYRAKADGRGTFSFYDQAMDRQMQSRRELTRDLRGAIGNNQLSLHYQPLYGNDGHTLTGYEALLRWQHPLHGNIPPVEFIPLAEETGLIDAIGVWVLQRACADAATWPAPLTVAVNLSAAQFSSGDLVGAVTQALTAAGLSPRRLELEITESLLMSNTDEVLKTLRTLSALGVPIAMDDFGTGYSSLAYLWRFPFDKVKIDRAFTHNLGSDPKVDLIVKSIITLAHSLDIRVNAEGVETSSQMAALQGHGCDELQGFLLGRPGPLQLLTHKGRAAADSMPQWLPARESLFAELQLDLPPTRPAPLN